MAKKKTAVKSRTKSQILIDLADGTGLSKKEVSAVFDGMAGLIKRDLSTRGPGVFAVPPVHLRLSATVCPPF